MQGVLASHFYFIASGDRENFTDPCMAVKWFNVNSHPAKSGWEVIVIEGNDPEGAMSFS